MKCPTCNQPMSMPPCDEPLVGRYFPAFYKAGEGWGIDYEFGTGLDVNGATDNLTELREIIAGFRSSYRDDEIPAIYDSVDRVLMDVDA